MNARYIILFLMITGALFITGCFPKADAGLDKKILIDLSVTLNGEGTELFGGPVTFEWDFGDGSPAVSDAAATHQYTATGTYTTTLTVTDQMGMTATDTADVEVMDWEVLPVPITMGSYTIDNPVMEFLPDGKMVILDGDTFELIEETDSSVPGARAFQYVTTLVPGGNSSCWAWGSFVEAVDYNTILAGTTCEIFKIDLLTGSAVEVGSDLLNYAGELDGSDLYVSAGDFSWPASKLVRIDITTGQATDLVTDIAGASGGVCLDGAGNIYTGNGYAPGPPDETGQIRRFDLSATPTWAWYTDGGLVADILSGSSLIWAADHTLLVGGSDLFGASGQGNYFSAVDLSVNPAVEIWKLDPDDPLDSYSSYAIKGDKTANMFSTVSWGGDFYLLPFEALGL